MGMVNGVFNRKVGFLMSTMSSVIWLQDKNKILVINPENQATWWLEGDAALIWSWLNSKVSFSRCVSLLAALNGENFATAREKTLSYVAAWQESGLCGNKSR